MRSYKFGGILIGDLFNTKSARWVKVNVDEAICVMSAVIPVGKIQTFLPDDEVVLLWSAVLATD